MYRYLRALLIKTPVVVAIGLFLAYLAFAYLAFPPLAKWAAEKYVADKTGHVLRLGEARFDPFALSLRLRDFQLQEPTGAPLLAFKELFVNFEAKSLFKWAYAFDQIRLSAPMARVELRPDGSLNWAAFVAALKDEETDDSGPPRLLIRELVIEQGVLDLVDRKVKGGLARRVEPLGLALSDLSTLPEDKGGYAISARTGSGESLRWKGEFGLKPELTARGELALDGIVPGKFWPYLGNGLALTAPEGKVALSLNYRLAYADKRMALNLDRVGLTGSGLRITDRGFVRPLTVEVDTLKLGLRADATFDGKALQARVEQGQLELAGLRLLDQGKATLFTLPGARLDGLSLDLAKRAARLERVALSGGRLEVVRERSGRIPLLTAFARRPAATAGPTAAAPASADWQYALGKLELSGFQFGWRDETVAPAAQFVVEQFDASLEGLSQDRQAALPLMLSFQTRPAGRFEAKGQLILAKPSLDLQLSLDAMSLLPAQPYVGQAANLSLVSGAVSSAGRLQYGPGGVSYRGGFAVRDLLLNEAGSKNRFLAWKSLATPNLRLDRGSLNIRELRLDRLGAKLVIYADKTVNLKKILKTAAAKPAAEAKPAPAPARDRADGFRVNIERIRVANSELDFADHSLQLPFGTRIHRFKGAFNGISSKPGSAAQLELDGQVDEHGLARAVGQIDLFDPTGFTDIKVVFRNVEMTRLTPYTATFAGRRINSGKLSLDLEYKINQRQLQGENQIIMDKLTLGERVESPTAKNLPLDLAIAILQDSDGRIDLGLPVSGSLDDPQFSYGQIVWKAIVNVITKIVTAPFRALGALFGAGGEKMGELTFDAGSARLLPPEREKLKQLAQALAKRPKLALTVQGTYAEPADRSALKARQLRLEVARRMGLKLAPGEDPGPLVTSEPEVQDILEDLYRERLGKAALDGMKDRYYQANPEQRKGVGKLLSTLGGLVKGKAAPLSESDRASLKGADLGQLLYQGLHEREPVAEAALVALATQRGEAIVRNLTETQGVAKARIQWGQPEKIEGDAPAVVAKLSLAVAAEPAPAAVPAGAPGR